MWHTCGIGCVGCVWKWEDNGSSGSKRLIGRENLVIGPEAGTIPIDSAVLWVALVANLSPL